MGQLLTGVSPLSVTVLGLVTVFTVEFGQQLVDGSDLVFLWVGVELIDVLDLLGRERRAVFETARGHCGFLGCHYLEKKEIPTLGIVLVLCQPAFFL